VHLQQLSSFGSRLDTAWTAVNRQSQPGERQHPGRKRQRRQQPAQAIRRAGKRYAADSDRARRPGCPTPAREKQSVAVGYARSVRRRSIGDGGFAWPAATRRTGHEVLAKLGPASHSSSVSISLRWKLQVLAQSLPAYAPTQTAATSPATSLAADTLNQLSA
jgi:hypothetical protein